MARRIAGWWLGLGLALGAGGAPAAAGTQDAQPSDVGAYRELTRMIAASPDPRQRLLAAYRLASRFDETPFDPRDPDQADARALFAGVRVGSSDPWVLWMVGNQCPFDAGLCDRDGALRQLTELQPDNAAAWLPVLNQAATRGDAAGVDEALARMAGASAWVDYYPETVRVLLAAFESLASNPRGLRLLIGAPDPGAAAQDGRGEVAATVGALGIALAFAIPAFSPLGEACKGEALDTRARRTDCRAVTRHLMASNTTIGQRVGAGFARRLAQDDAERAEIALFERRLDWQIQAQMTAFRALETLDGRAPTDADLRLLRTWTAALRTTASEPEATAAVLAALNLPLDPPASYRSPERPEPIDD